MREVQAMVHTAATAAAPRRTSSSTGYGVPMPGASLTLGRVSKMHSAGRKPNLVDRQATVGDLKREASLWPKKKVSAANWLEFVFAKPTRKRVQTTWARWYPLEKEGTLGYWELRAFALDWDREGWTSPQDFAEGVEMEVKYAKATGRGQECETPEEEQDEIKVLSETDPYGLYHFDED